MQIKPGLIGNDGGHHSPIGVLKLPGRTASCLAEGRQS